MTLKTRLFAYLDVKNGRAFYDGRSDPAEALALPRGVAV